MINEMLKSARGEDADGWLGDEGDTGSDSAMDMAQSQFANALAARGGLGLAPVIVQAMSPHLAQPQNATEKPPPGSPMSPE